MTRHRHDPITQSLHWIIALGIVAAYAIGLVREELPKGDFRAWLLTLHMSLGMLVFALSLARIGWRSVATGPAPLPAKPAAKLAAKAVHLMLYATMLAIPVIGLFAAWAKGRTVGFFNIMPLPSPIAIDKDLAKTLESLHEVAGHAMMALAGLHAAAAIGHQYLLRDGTLGRMLPFVSAKPAPKIERPYGGTQAFAGE